MPTSQSFKNLSMNSIRMNFAETEDLRIGTSKFGGLPHLPEGFSWPRFEGADYLDDTTPPPLSFLLQVNCAEVHPYDKEGKLPASGMLYFFYELASMTWGFDPKDKGSARVYYYDCPAEDLKPCELPDDLEEDYRLPELRIDFESQESFPDPDEMLSGLNVNWDGYEETVGEPDESEEQLISKLLGYADILQDEMLTECEMVTNGIYCGSAPKIDKNQQKSIKARAADWTLLMQLDTVESGDFELMFGDSGRIYYYIKKEDLARRDFDNCWLCLQCF